LIERMATDVVAGVAAAPQPANLAACARAAAPLIKAAGVNQDDALGFLYALRELNRIAAFGTRQGARLHEPLAQGGVFYIKVR
jgi:hypothetical protein